jgi:O-antigen/teichoic acid export membrane protein
MSVRKSVFWSFGGQGLSSILAFATSVALARLLTPHEFGIYAIAIAAQGMLQVFATFSVGAYVTRHDAPDETVLAAAFTINALISLALSLAMLGLSFLTAPLLGAAEAGNVLRLLALTPIIGIFTFRPAAMLQREMAFQTISIILFVNVVITSAVTLTSAWAGASYASAAFGLVAGALFQATAYSVVAPRHVSLRVSLVNWSAITKFGLNIVSVSGVSLLMARLSEIILGRTLGLATLGLYGRAAGVANILAENIYGTATKISYVKLAQDAREHGDLRPTFLRSMHLVLGLLWPMQIGLAVLAGPVVNALYGSDWSRAALPLSLLMIGQCVSMVVGMNWELFAVRDEMFRQTRLEVTRSSVGFVLFVVGTQFGLAAAATARIGEALFSILIYRRHVPRLARTEPGDLSTIWTQNAVLAIAAVFPAAGLMAAHGWSATTPLWQVGTAIMTGVALWLSALFRLHHPLREELMLILGRLSAKRRN